MVVALDVPRKDGRYLGLDLLSGLRACLRVWLQVFFKVFFVLKCIKIMFFYFKKIIFEISALKQSKTYKKY
jgi:hypothetical protein